MKENLNSLKLLFHAIKQQSGIVLNMEMQKTKKLLKFIVRISHIL